MKSIRTLLLALLLCALTACSAREMDPPPLGTDGSGQEETCEPVYQFETMAVEETFTSETDVPFAHYSYHLLTMSVSNPEDLSPEVREKAEANVENFNARMQELMDDSVAWGRELGEMAKEAYAQGSTTLSYEDETTASGYLLGQTVSVRLDNFDYAGGAHPNSYTMSYTFDLGSGQFIDPAQIADDPDAFRTGTAELLVEKADALGEEYTTGYWQDYRDVIGKWNEGAVIFGETGMTVVFSVYELGPYAMGPVELFLRYDELADLLGPGGLARLGVGTGETEP